MGRNPDYHFSTQEIEALWQSDLSINKISKTYPVSERRIKRLFVDRYGAEAVEQRQKRHLARQADHFAKPIPEPELDYYFHSDLPIKSICKELGRKASVVKDLFVARYGGVAYLERSQRIARLRLARNAKQRLVVRYQDAMGYWVVPTPDWFDAVHAYMHEHRLIYAQVHGLTSIPRDMHVHHIDGNKDNNDPSNLQLLSASAHRKLHVAQQDTPRERNDKGQFSPSHTPT